MHAIVLSRKLKSVFNFSPIISMHTVTLSFTLISTIALKHFSLTVSLSLSLSLTLHIFNSLHNIGIRGSLCFHMKTPLNYHSSTFLVKDDFNGNPSLFTYKYSVRL